MKAKLKSENLILYTETLVGTANTDLTSYHPAGNFTKRILILTDLLSANSDEQILLDKMLAATGNTTEDIYHIQLEKRLPLRLLIDLRPERVICFGGFINNESVSFANRLYKISQINDIQILMTHNLSKISDSNELKQALWNALKKMFDL